MSSATPELSLEGEAVRNIYVDAAPSLRDTFKVISQETQPKRDFRRPVWLSPELAAFVVGVLDWCLILTAAGAAFTIYFGVMDQAVAWPERHILTAFLAATVFAGVFERLGGYRLKQLSRLKWQVTRVLITLATLKT